MESDRQRPRGVQRLAVGRNVTDAATVVPLRRRGHMEGIGKYRVNLRTVNISPTDGCVPRFNNLEHDGANDPIVTVDECPPLNRPWGPGGPAHSPG